AAVRGIEPTDGRSIVGPARELARAYTTVVDPDAQVGPGEAPAALELWSDGRIADIADQVLKPGETLEYHRVGEERTRNVGIASIAAERPYDQPGRIQVFVAVENPDPEPRSIDLQLAVDGSVRSITPEPLEIPAARDDPQVGWLPGRRQLAFTPIEQSRGAVIEASILGEDGLASDDVAALVVPPARSLRVALVGRNRPVLRSLLEGMPLESLELLTPERFLAQLEEDSGDGWDLVILADVELPLAALPPGRYLSFGRTPPAAGLDEYGEPTSNAIVRKTRDSHPILRMVNLDDLFVGSMRKVVPGPGVVVLVDSGDGPLVLESDRGGVRLVHVTFDPLDSNWPYLRSFVNFTANAVDHLGNADDALTAKAGEPGFPISTRIPRGSNEVTLTPPGGEPVDLSLTPDGVVSWGPVRRTGLHEISWTDPRTGERASRTIAVNQLDRNERRVAASDAVEIGTEQVDGRRAVVGGSRWQDLWPWILAAVLALSFLEWFIWQRQAGAG
ncbi:MAG: hypothetical protein VX672_02090, partial [Planctomycetota bacterium]|nr:hypothetical protein [Planctomycetota bacterium]